jgi:hypothetical protein
MSREVSGVERGAGLRSRAAALSSEFARGLVNRRAQDFDPGAPLAGSVASRRGFDSEGGMRDVPFSGSLDMALACLLVIERHGSVANRCVTRDDLTEDVLSLLGSIEVPPACLSDIDAFEVELECAVLRLVAAGWIEDRSSGDAARFAPRPVAEDALAWMRSRLLADARRVAAFDRLDEAVTRRVLSDYGHTAPAERPAAPQR